MSAWYGRLDSWLRCGFRVPDRPIPNHPFPTPGSPLWPWPSLHDCRFGGMLGRESWVALGVYPNTGPGSLVVVVSVVSVGVVIVVPVWLVHAQH